MYTIIGTENGETMECSAVHFFFKETCFPRQD